MKILLYKDSQLVQELQLKSGQTYSVGRRPDCDLVLEKLPAISRKHFEIVEDQPNQWRVNVLSEVKLVTFNDEERKDFSIDGEGDFFLNPYTFKFVSNDSFSHGQQTNPSPGLTPLVESQTEEIADSQAGHQLVDEPSSEPDTFAGGDEKTAIQNFSGLPYIKIIGEGGKKSEYFRLEGNLWIVGGDESASVYLKDSSVAANHFEISKTDKGFFIIDLGTPLGTNINGQKLTPKKPHPLLSGDIISIGQSSLQFELRDNAFKRKVSNIPLNMYKNPLVFFDKEVAMVSFEDQAPGQAEALAIEDVDDEARKQSRKRLFLVAAAVIMLMAFAASELLNSASDNTQQLNNSDPFTRLSPAEQKIVKRTYKLAHQLYLNKNYELALVQLDKLHSILPTYKDSRKYEEDCINDREIQQQKALIEQQRRAQEKLRRKVVSFISQCKGQYKKSDDIDGVKACLVPAADLDPNNPEIASLISEVTARHEEKKIREKMARERQDKIARGQKLYDKARSFHNKNNWLKAIEAYENHIHSGLPDPDNLVKKSKRSLANIEYQVRSKKQSFFGQAKNVYKQNKLKDAIHLARRAQQVDPYDPRISNFLFGIEKELENRMKAIYLDSVIEERFGNLEASRIKWEEILKKDVPDGQYYKKAERKLKQYGYQY